MRIRRHDVLLGVLAIGLIGLTIKLGWTLHRFTEPLTAHQQRIAERVARAQAGRRVVLPLPARPGNIYARSHRSAVLLAGSRQVPSCFADPALMSERDIAMVSEQLGAILQMDPADIYVRLITRHQQRFAWVARQISPDQADAIEALNLRAVGIQHEWQRQYPNGPLAGTVVGFTMRDGRAGEGIELTARRALQAFDGLRIMGGDAGGRAIWARPEQSRPPRDGHHICLTIDVNIQRFLQQAVSESVQTYQAQWGTGVVVNPWTGEVLAMCSVPTYDPNAYNTTPREAMLNRALSLAYEPGSIFKPLIAASAVQLGKLSYESRIDCENGTYHAHRGGRITDHGQSYSMLTLADVVVHSSNIGMAKVGEAIGNRLLWKVVHNWGFGKESGIQLPGETGGIVNPLQRWTGYSLRRVPFGQEISASALQLAMAFSAVANGGELLRPQIVRSVSRPDGQVIWKARRRVVRRVLDEPVARRTRRVMREVIERGTGKKCLLRGYSAFGKTGTAQVAGKTGGYIDGAYTASFVAGAPVETPAIICLISIHRPGRKSYYGGTVAAPYVKDVLEKTLVYLNIPPDQATPHYAAGPDRTDAPESLAGSLGTAPDLSETIRE